MGLPPAPYDESHSNANQNHTAASLKNEAETSSPDDRPLRCPLLRVQGSSTPHSLPQLTTHDHLITTCMASSAHKARPGGSSTSPPLLLLPTPNTPPSPQLVSALFSSRVCHRRLSGGHRRFVKSNRSTTEAQLELPKRALLQHCCVAVDETCN
jgi:hypothetical protein